MENKTICITETQYRNIYKNALRESLIVNVDLVKSIKKWLDRHFRPVAYDDVNEDGDIIEPYAVQSLSRRGEPLQTLSLWGEDGSGDANTLLGKVEKHYHDKIKDDSDRRKFFKQLITDWIGGRISREGLLSVNTIR